MAAEPASRASGATTAGPAAAGWRPILVAHQVMAPSEAMTEARTAPRLTPRSKMVP